MNVASVLALPATPDTLAAESLTVNAWMGVRGRLSRIVLRARPRRTSTAPAPDSGARFDRLATVSDRARHPQELSERRYAVVLRDPAHVWGFAVLVTRIHAALRQDSGSFASERNRTSEVRRLVLTSMPTPDPEIEAMRFAVDADTLHESVAPRTGANRIWSQISAATASCAAQPRALPSVSEVFRACDSICRRPWSRIATP